VGHNLVAHPELLLQQYQQGAGASLPANDVTYAAAAAITAAALPSAADQILPVGDGALLRK
jgi:hypothetical protein